MHNALKKFFKRNNAIFKKILKLPRFYSLRQKTKQCETSENCTFSDFRVLCHTIRYNISGGTGMTT